MQGIVAIYIIVFIVITLTIAAIIFVMLVSHRKKVSILENHLRKEAEFEKTILLKEIQNQKIVLSERARIARDMHDDLGAGLSAIKLQLEFVNRKLENGNTVEDDINDLMASADSLHLSMREMLWNLNASELDSHSFSKYAARYSQQFLERANIQIQIHQQLGEAAVTFSPEKSRHLLMCLKEGLNNVVKHSKANIVELNLIQNDQSFEIHLQDNGVGFSDRQPEGMGLENIQNRMKNIGGYATWTSTESGCLLVLCL